MTNGDIKKFAESKYDPKVNPRSYADIIDALLWAREQFAPKVSLAKRIKEAMNDAWMASAAYDFNPVACTYDTFTEWYDEYIKNNNPFLDTNEDEELATEIEIPKLTRKEYLKQVENSMKEIPPKGTSYDLNNVPGFNRKRK